MDPLKEMFNKAFYERLANTLHESYNDLHPGKFVKDVTKNMEDLSLNQRMRNTSVMMKKHLPGDFRKSIDIMKKAVPQMPRGYTTLIFPDFTGLYGLDDLDTSLEALSYFTKFGSSEFAVREFLKKDFKKTIRVMEKWADNKDEHIRRLASEGSRARLPWSFKLDEVIKNPGVTRPILEKLKTDDALYVRKSVANHLNDFSRDQPEYLLEVVGSWNLDNPNTSWIVKHACRTLIKKGDKATLKLFSFEENVKIELNNLKLNKNKLRLGETLEFSFDVQSKSKKAQKLVIDYCIHYFKKTEGLSPKVFKLKEVSLEPGALLQIRKKQLFTDFTTRKHYSGRHGIEIMVNGKIYGKKEFDLLV